MAYTFTYSQDVLYRLKDWLDANLTLTTEYVEVIDAKSVRVRISKGEVFDSVQKRVVNVNRVAVPVDDVNFVPMTVRECVEINYKDYDEQIKRVCKTRVYRTSDNVEIKFEQIYYEQNVGDFLDPLTASKQITLYNILKPDDAIDVTINSHLGSDEILANCRLELEYESTAVSRVQLYKTAHLIDYIEGTVLRDVVVVPFLCHTTMLNEICYRPFAQEKLLNEVNNLQDIKMWTLKLDGVRGKGYVVNGRRLYVQLDDMRLFAGSLIRKAEIEYEAEVISNLEDSKNPPMHSGSSPNSASFLHNRVIGIQVEYVRDTFFVTDVLNVRKYKYDNRNQYDVAAAVGVDVFDAVSFMNKQKKIFTFKDDDGTEHRFRFQTFYTHVKNVDVTLSPNDGYVGITSAGELVKIKPQKSYEMMFTPDGRFVCSFGEFVDKEGGWKRDTIYEVVIIIDNIVRVIKERPDRLISN